MNTALTGLQLTSPTDPEWYPDSGATAHLAKQPGNLSSLRPYYGLNRIVAANGSTLPITHIGSAKVGSLSLKNVYAVPSVSKNLISVSKLTKENDCLCEFTADCVVIKDQKTGKVLQKGSSKGGMYVLRSNEDEENKAFLCDGDRWHARLGHP